MLTEFCRQLFPRLPAFQDFLSAFFCCIIFGNIINYICYSKFYSMDFGKEFEKYAVKHRGISSNMLDDYQRKNGEKFNKETAPFLRVGGPYQITNLTPNIIEERPMNIAVMDVYSRLMMDRIIFMGYPVSD